MTKPLYRIVVAVVALLVLVVPASADASWKIEEILQRTGILRQFEEVPIAFERAADELAAVSADENFKEDFLIVSRAVFNVEGMVDQCIAIFRERFPEEYEAPISDFLQSSLGERINESELYSSSLVNTDVVETIGAKILDALADSDPDRLELYDRMVNDLGLVEQMESLASNVGYAMLVGVFASGKGPVTVPHDGIKALMKAGQEEMRRELRRKVMAHSAFAYRDFSLEEMATYVDVLKTDAGQKFYETLFFAFEEILSPRSLEFGRRLAAQRNSRKT